MEREFFEQLVEDAFAQMPPRIKERIKNVALLVEDEPADDVRAYHGLEADETLLGHYHGIPLSARGEEYGGLVMPDTITIYQEPILDAADEECPEDASDDEYLDHVRRIIAETVWHEYAHHFGMNEAEVRAWEQKRSV